MDCSKWQCVGDDVGLDIDTTVGDEACPWLARSGNGFGENAGIDVGDGEKVGSWLAPNSNDVGAAVGLDTGTVIGDEVGV